MKTKRFFLPYKSKSFRKLYGSFVAYNESWLSYLYCLSPSHTYPAAVHQFSKNLSYHLGQYNVFFPKISFKSVASKEVCVVGMILFDPTTCSHSVRFLGFQFPISFCTGLIASKNACFLICLKNIIVL